jgi:hypothetical protein
MDEFEWKRVGWGRLEERKRIEKEFFAEIMIESYSFG